jgi:hypothetical protein
MSACCILRRRGLLALATLVAVSSTWSANHAAEPVDGKHAADLIDRSAIKVILAHWERRRARYRNAEWNLVGTEIVSQGYYSSEPSMRELLPAGLEGVVPAQDRRSPLSIELTLDFQGRRGRRGFARETFYIDAAQFIPDVEIDLYDGREYVNLAPREKNTSASYRPSRYQPDVTFRGASPVNARTVDLPVLMYHGRFPTFKGASGAEEYAAPAVDDVLSIHESKLDGDSIAVLEFNRGAAESPSILEMWLSADKDLAPVRLVFRAGTSPQQAAVMEIVHRDIDGDWRPEQWTLRHYAADGSTEKMETLRVESVAFDQRFCDALFQANVQPGMVVNDMRSDEEYVKGKPGEPDVPVKTLKERNGDQLQ